MLSYAKLKAPLERALDAAATVSEEPQRPAPSGPAQGYVEVRLGSAGVEQLLAEYSTGTPTRKLAQRYGLSKTAVRDLLRRQGVTVRTIHSMSPDEVSEAIGRYDAGWSLDLLSKHLGFSAATIRTTLSNHGVAIRARRGWRY